MRRKFGDQDCCSRCGQDVEWHGAHGWLDRGGNTLCPPYRDRKTGEIVTPQKTRHVVKREG